MAQQQQHQQQQQQHETSWRRESTKRREKVSGKRPASPKGKCAAKHRLKVCCHAVLLVPDGAGTLPARYFLHFIWQPCFRYSYWLNKGYESLLSTSKNDKNNNITLSVILLNFELRLSVFFIFKLLLREAGFRDYEERNKTGRKNNVFWAIHL